MSVVTNRQNATYPDPIEQRFVSRSAVTLNKGMERTVKNVAALAKRRAMPRLFGLQLILDDHRRLHCARRLERERELDNCRCGCTHYGNWSKQGVFRKPSTATS